MRRALNHVGLIVLVLLATGCAGQVVAPSEPLDAIQAQTEVPESQLLDVGIEVFDPGLPDPKAPPSPKTDDKIFPEVRKSEARYFPVQLKETLESTGHWGAVRVIPSGVEGATVDLTITGKILESTGKDLELEVKARDATGRVWLEKRYKAEANPSAYVESTADAIRDRDPFQDLFNRVANDLLADRRQLDPEELVEIRRVSELLFARDLAPEPFEGYVEQDRRGRYSVARMPASDDPMVGRLARIRARDHLFVDTLNEHYAAFSAQMEDPYTSWRQYSYEEQLALEEVRRQARTRMALGILSMLGALVADVDNRYEAAARDAAMIGGMMAVQSGLSKRAEAKIHVEALKELGVSFELEMAPMVVEVEGETLRLSGSAETQYSEWRRLLRELYATETGLVPEPEPNRTGEENPAGL